MSWLELLSWERLAVEVYLTQPKAEKLDEEVLGLLFFFPSSVCRILGFSSFMSWTNREVSALISAFLNISLDLLIVLDVFSL